MTSTRETGWYRDPDHPDRHRFWDGHQWQSQNAHLRAVQLVERAQSLVPTQSRREQPTPAAR